MKGVNGEAQREAKNRLQTYLDNDAKPPLVEDLSGAYLLEALFLAGPTKAGPMGDLPLEWMDLYAFAQCTEDVTEAWELKALHKMSDAYHSAQERGKNPFAKSPVEMTGYSAG
ncbi:MAG: hypothetical protein JXR13_18750 [Thalassovita sp.]